MKVERMRRGGPVPAAKWEVSQIVDKAIRHEITWDECREMIEVLRLEDRYVGDDLDFGPDDPSWV